MSAADEIKRLEPARLRELFDLQGDTYQTRGGSFDGDIYAEFHRLRETGPVHEGVLGPLVGYHGEGFFQGLPFPDRAHFSVFDYETCDAVLRDLDHFRSSEHPPDSEAARNENMILSMDGARHRRYRTLVQPSFIPRRAQWWIERWIHATVEALVDSIGRNGKADLNVEFFAPIPLLTICGSFGVSVTEALDIRAAVTSDGVGADRFIEILTPIIAARRDEPTDDLISVLVQAEVVDDDGVRHVLSDDEVQGFAFLLLAAGSGTTWKQMGITMLALLEHPDWIDRIRQAPEVLRAVIEESLRWMPTDPMFSRFVIAETELAGIQIPVGAVVHLCFGAANRDPKRWERPDDFDPSRPVVSHLGFGGGPHICLGMHVARAEMTAAIGAAIGRLPSLRLDPDAPAPKVTGMYERGPTSVPVVFD
jgi:cytochrome P450